MRSLGVIHCSMTLQVQEAPSRELTLPAAITAVTWLILQTTTACQG